MAGIIIKPILRSLFPSAERLFEQEPGYNPPYLTLDQSRSVLWLWTLLRVYGWVRVTFLKDDQLLQLLGRVLIMTWLRHDLSEDSLLVQASVENTAYV